MIKNRNSDRGQRDSFAFVWVTNYLKVRYGHYRSLYQDCEELVVKKTFRVNAKGF